MKHFTAIYPEEKNFTPSELMKQHADLNRGHKFLYDEYFKPYILYAGTRYYYDHWKLESCSGNGYICVTVFLTEKKTAPDLPDFNSPEAFFCEPD